MSLNLHTALFLLAAALLVVHEMDAMRCREWRIFPLLSRIDERVAMPFFLWAHVPILILVIWGIAGAVSTGGDLFSLVFSGLCVFHAFLHLAYERHPLNEFRTPLSRTIIWSCASAGFAAMAVTWAQG